MQRLLIRSMVCALVAVLTLGVPGAWAGDPVAFSGQVKKVMADKNKVGIKDPETKKQFTVVIGEKSKLEGYKGIADIKKGDSVKGAYQVTDDGLYVVTEMKKE